MSDENKPKHPMETLKDALAPIMQEKRVVAANDSKARTDAVLKKYETILPKKSLNEAVNDALLNEVSPPNADIKKWAEKDKVKSAFKKRYGDKWKSVMYGRAWNMYNKRKEQGKLEETLSDEDILAMLPEEERKIIEEEMNNGDE